jgi:serine carboxypeptidase-like clade 1
MSCHWLAWSCHCQHRPPASLRSRSLLVSHRPRLLGIMLSLLALALVPLTLGAPLQDLVTSLPGWAAPLPSKIYSGFIDAGSDVQDGQAYNVSMWYMFVEAEESPLTAPVLLWSNGGPGASSAYGLFTELGPFYLSSESLKADPPTLFRNDFSWSKLANVLILNGPAPVGYSYCLPAGPAGPFTSCGSWNDTRTFDFNLRFVNNFFAAFPEYKANDFYIAGESFAGVYTGMLVDGLLNASTQLNLRGLALGDACMGVDVLCGGGEKDKGPWLSILFDAGQGCISLPTFEAILALCPMPLLKTGPISALPADCQRAIAASSEECPGNAYYAYNYLDQCPPDPFRAVGALPGPPPQPSGYPCGGDGALTQWITSPATKAALHIPADAAYHSADNGNGFVYNLTWASNLPLLRRLQTGKDGVKVLIYNGETDPSVSSVKSQEYSFGLGFPVADAWRPWTFGAAGPEIVAGQIVQWEGNISHATIRGSGYVLAAQRNAPECAGSFQPLTHLLAIALYPPPSP